jgi:hypothetical protein
MSILMRHMEGNGGIEIPYTKDEESKATKVAKELTV